MATHLHTSKQVNTLRCSHPAPSKKPDHHTLSISISFLTSENSSDSVTDSGMILIATTSEVTVSIALKTDPYDPFPSRSRTSYRRRGSSCGTGFFLFILTALPLCHCPCNNAFTTNKASGRACVSIGHDGSCKSSHGVGMMLYRASSVTSRPLVSTVDTIRIEQQTVGVQSGRKHANSKQHCVSVMLSSIAIAQQGVREMGSEMYMYIC